jgi:glycosyltransferase involved in cell wall biosynthesis
VSPRLTVRGPYRGVSGHDRHTREFVRHLVRAGVRVALVDIPEWHPVKLPEALRDPWFDTLTGPVPSRLVLHFCMPHQVAAVPGRRHVNYTMFEASRVPGEWVALGRRHDLVVVPTESSRDAWLAGGFPPQQLRLCPLGVDPERFHPGVPPMALTDRRGRPLGDYAVRVLNVSALTPRKNVTALLRVWLQTTTADDDAILVLKLGPGGPGARLALLRDLALLEHARGTRRQDAAPVLFVDRTFSDAEMPRLFAAATHYWSMSRGEGWDQPMLEAAATGLRLIAPRHTAYTAYLDDAVATLLPAQRVPATIAGDDGLRRLFEGAFWWEPDAAAAAEAIRRAVERADSGLGSPRAKVVPALSWEAAVRRLLAITEELEP